MAPDPLTVESLRAALGSDRLLGDPVQAYEVAISVDALAMGWARQQQAPEGALVVADTELSARGRRGVVWTSVAGASLAFSVVLRPDLPPQAEGLLWILASLAAAEGLSGASGLEVGCKWPNDLLVDGARLGLVTIDAQLGPGRIAGAVITVRCNVDEVEVPESSSRGEPVTSLRAAGGDEVGRAELIRAVLERLEVRYDHGVSELLAAYRERCVTLDTRVRLGLMPRGEIVGRAVDVDEEGRLVLERAGERTPIAAEDVQRVTTQS